jgi:hypothetical protein
LDPDERISYLDRQAVALYREGEERGNKAALRRAIAICMLVLQKQVRDLAGILSWRARLNTGLCVVILKISRS